MRSTIAGFVVAVGLAAAFVVSQPPPPAATGELQFPRQSTPASCGVGREGRVYYDLDDDTPRYCDDTNWVPFGTTISGTFPFVPRFNSAGTNIEDSVIRATGLPAAGAGGSVVDITQTLNAMDGSDTVTVFNVAITNADHAGSGNNLFGLNIAGITRDDQATETALVIGSGWDRAINAAGSAFIISGFTPSAATSGQIALIQGFGTAAMNGSDTVTGLIVLAATSEGNHTGANNRLIGIKVHGPGTPDADSTKIGIELGDGSGGTNLWDYDLQFQAEGALGTNTHFYNDHASGNFVWDSNDPTPDYIFAGEEVAQVVFQLGKEITHLMGTDLSLSGTTLTIDPNATVVEVFGDGADTVSVITAPITTSHTERVTFICQDADVTFLDADAAGAAGTINLAGSATDFVCSADDTLTLAYYVAPVSGNARWVEVSRSVN